MANELKHASAGTSLTQAEFEAIGLHVLDSQATGDIIYASSAAQLSRLGITADRILGVSGGIPAWVNTLPAVTLNGAISGGDQSWTNVGDMTFAAGSVIASGSTNGNTLLLKANDTPFITLTTGATDTMILGKAFFFDAGGESIESDGTYLTITSSTTKFSGGLATGGATPDGKYQNLFGGNFTSDGSDNFSYKNRYEGVLTGASGDTTKLAGTLFFNQITTQTAAEVLAVAAQAYFVEPTITKNVTTITTAATVYIQDAPTEGVTNAALYVASGDTNLSTVTLRGAMTAGGNTISSYKQTLENHTADNTLTRTETGSIHTNYGDTGTHTQTLPSDAVAGDKFYFFIATAQELRVKVGAAGHAIIVGGTTHTDDGGGDLYISADDEGEYLELSCITTGVFGATLINGTWTVTQP